MYMVIHVFIDKHVSVALIFSIKVKCVNVCVCVPFKKAVLVSGCEATH